MKVVPFINPYLSTTKILYMKPLSKSISGFPEMISGSKTNDFNNFMFDESERDSLINQYPQANRIVKRFVGAAEFIKGQIRYCL